MIRSAKTKPIEKPLLHKNYEGAKHVPEYLRIYGTKVAKPCKWCGADPKDIVVYSMPLKNGKRVKVTRCTVCDNLIYFGSTENMTRGDINGRKRPRAGNKV